MERINKIVCTDSSKSHRKGLLPYAVSNSIQNRAFIYSTSLNGNYGQYVCDIIDKNDKENPLLYLDIISRYNFVQEQINNGIKTRKYNYSETLVVSINCEPCSIVDKKEQKSKWTPNLREEDDILDIYSFCPSSDEWFIEDYNGDFELNSDIDASSIPEKTIIIPNYNKVMEIEAWWSSWWDGKNKSEIFEGYNENFEYFGFCQDVEKYILGIVRVPSKFLDRNGKIKEISGSKVPNIVSYFERGYYLDIFNSLEQNRKSDSRAAEEWENYGGDTFKYFLENITPHWVTKDGETLVFNIPHIDIPTLITDNSIMESYYEPYEYSYNEQEGVFEGAVQSYSAVESGACSSLTPHFIAIEEGGDVESELYRLISPKASEVADGIYGIFAPFGTKEIRGNTVEIGEMFECTYIVKESDVKAYTGNTIITRQESGVTIVVSSITDYESEEIWTDGEVNQVINPRKIGGSTWKETNEEQDGEFLIKSTSAFTIGEYSWWQCVKTDKEPKCADGEDVSPNDDTLYQNLPILSAINSIIPNPKNGDSYIILARYKNGPYLETKKRINIFGQTTPVTLSVPIELLPLNETTFDNGEVSYDKITKIEPIGNKIKIEYVIGATSGQPIGTSGIHYKEELPYSGAVCEKVYLDLGTEAELWYDKIDFNGNSTYVYNDEYRIGRSAKMAKLTGLEVCTEWTSSAAVNTMLITKDGGEDLKEEPSYDINLTYDRGNAAAWERHFKLSECNTLEDLTNYGNNFFKI